MAPAVTSLAFPAMTLATATVLPTIVPTAPAVLFQRDDDDDGPYCIPFQDPDQGVKGYCNCDDGGKYSFISDAEGGGICGYTSPAPSSASYTPTPASTSAAPEHTGIECQTGLNPGMLCWFDLDLTEYVKDWWGDNEGDCESYNGFADCWYAKMTKYAPSSCDQLNVDPGCTQPLWKDFSDDAEHGAQNFYVSWAIWNTQGFFLDLYTAIGDSSGHLSDNIGAIILAMDPPKEGGSKWEYLFDALTFGLSLYSEGTILVKALLRSAPQSSTLFNKLLFPPGSVEGEIEAWADVAKELGDFTAKWQKSVGSGLPDIVNGVDVFTGFCEMSGGITAIRPPLDGLTDSISQSVGAFTISAIINQLDFVVTRTAGQSIADIQANNELWWDAHCGDGYDDNGVCDAFFYDGTDTYSIVNGHGYDEMKTSYADLLGKLIGGESPLTTGELLFTQGYQCTTSCGQNGGCEPKIDDPANPPTCLSTIRVCDWSWDERGPFDNCKNLPDSDAVLPYFGVDPCVGSDGFGDVSVPYSYFGGGIIKGSDAPGYWKDTLVCNSDY